MSTYIDVWINKRIEKDRESSPDNEDSHLYITDLRRWIFKLVDLVLHKDMNVTCGSLESLRNIVTSCRRLSGSLSPLDKVTDDGHLLESLLVLLAPTPKVKGARMLAGSVSLISFKSDGSPSR